MKHIGHYFPIILILLVGVGGFVYFSYDRFVRFILVIALALSYLIWGVAHHYIHKDLSPSIVLEYVAYAVLGVVVVFSLLFRV